MWSITVPFSIARTSNVPSMVIRNTNGILGCPQQVADDCHARVNAVFGLLEIVCFRIRVHILGDFAHPRQRMQDAHILFGSLEHAVFEYVDVFDAFVLHRVGKALALHARHINDVALIDHVRRELVSLAVTDAVLIAEVLVFLWHLQLVARHEIERRVEIRHCHQQ